MSAVILPLNSRGALVGVGTASWTGPTKLDRDGDGLSDGLEDSGGNGRREFDETNAMLWDTDRDGLPDGWANVSTTPGVSTWIGEDKNLNGIRDQDAGGNWTETDALANDSDVDGVLDGAEVNGSWCYSTETAAQCTGASNNASRMLDPLNPDFDGDGLRDGQEIAGWIVGTWREVTMERIANYTVASNPKVADSDLDGNSDFTSSRTGATPGRRTRTATEETTTRRRGRHRRYNGDRYPYSPEAPSTGAWSKRSSRGSFCGGETAWGFASPSATRAGSSSVRGRR